MVNPSRIVRSLLPILAILALALPGLGAKKKEEPELPKPPPQPVPQKVTVARRGKVEITLRVYERPPGTVQYQIRSKPDWGKLTAPKAAGRDAATVTYEPPADLTVKSDKFLYASRTPAGVSAPAEVSITITDEPARLVIPDELTFEPLRAGQTASQRITIKNEGGSVAEGEVQVDAPWKIREHRGYSLEHGQEREFTVIFAPTEGGKFKREIRYTSHRARITTLIGEAIFPLSFTPKKLELTREPNQTARSGAVEVRNETDEAHTLQVRASTRWKVPATIDVPANSSAPFILSLPHDDLEPVKESVKLSGAGLELELPVEAPRVPAVLHAPQKEVSFTGAGPVQVPVRNAGGTSGYWEASVKAPFAVDVKEVRLAARQQGAVTLRVEAEKPGRYSGELRLIGEHQTVTVPMDALVTGVAPGPRPESPRSAPPPARSSASARSSAPASPPPTDFPTAAEPDRAPAPPRDPTTMVGVPFPTVKGGVVTLEWAAAISDGQPIRAELRQMVRETKKKMRTEWHELRDVQVATANGRTRVELRRLPPGQMHIVRFSALDPANRSWRPLFQVPVTIPPAEGGTWLNRWFFLTLGAVAGIALLVWQRVRRR